MALLLAWLTTTAWALSPRLPLGPVAIALPDAPEVRLTVKFRDVAVARGVGIGFTFGPGVARADLDAVLAAWNVELSPLLKVDGDRLDALRARAEARTGRAAADLRGIYVVDAPNADADTLLAIAHDLETVASVEYVYLQGGGWAPPGDLAPTTDDWVDEQDWRGPDPGIDVDYAAARGVRGATVGIADCEYDWNARHEDLVDVDLGREPGQRSPSWTEDYAFDQHGTAAVGVIVAGDNGYGALGAAPDAIVSTWPEYSDSDGERRADSIAEAVAAADVGDIVMLEMQAIPRSDGDYAPAETDPNVYEVVRTATEAGIVVIAAAGNGAEDLDSSWYARSWLDWGDSGAIIVGAGSPDEAHDAAYFSTYGARVDVQGWGWNVFTLGYGDVYEPGNDIDQAYTLFSGTSSATPMVAAAAVLIQDFRLSRGAPPLDSVAMRDLLVATGIPQGDGEHVGPLPDIAAAIRSMDADGDDHLALVQGGDDCDDADHAAHPGSLAPELGFDADCDGAVEDPVLALADSGCGCETGKGAAESAAWLALAALLRARRARGR